MKHTPATITISVHDPAKLSAAAEWRAQKEGMTPDRWRALRADGGDRIANDLVMLFDPLLHPDYPTGVDVEGSEARVEYSVVKKRGARRKR